MRRILSFLFAISLCLGAQAQIFGDGISSDENPNKSWFGWGIGGGWAHMAGVNYGAFSATLACKGFYVGIGGLGPAHGSSTDVDEHFDDKSFFYVHGGYQIPLTKVFRIIPVVGYARMNSVYVDGSRYTVTKDGIHNFTSSKSLGDKLDFGGVACFAIGHFTMYFTGTRYTVCATFGCEI